MRQRKPWLRRFGFAIFVIGILLGVLLILARAVPDLEASLYGFANYGYPRLTSLSCPVLMTTSDTLPVKIRLENPLDRTLKFYISSQFSGILITTNEQTVDLQPGEKKTIAWNVGKDNVDLRYFVFARVFTSANMPKGMHEALCGTFALNLPIKNGPAIFFTTLFMALLLTLAGLLIWIRHADMSINAVVYQQWWMIFITVLASIGVVSGIFNAWFLAVIMVILIILSTSVFAIGTNG